MKGYAEAGPVAKWPVQQSFPTIANASRNFSSGEQETKLYDPRR
jgi:hypothetical protein